MADNHRNAHTRLSRNAIASVAGQLIYLLTRVGLPPFILLHVSLQDYSIWATCFLVLSYIGMSTFGIAGVYIRYSAEYYAHGRLDDIGRMMGAGIWMTLALGGMILGGLWFAMPWLYTWFHVDPGMQDTMRLLVLGVVGAMLLELLVPYGYVMGGIHRNAENSVISLVCSTLEAVLIVLFLLQGWGLVGMMGAYVLRAVLSLSITMTWFHRLLPGFKIQLRGLGRAQWRPFLEYGGVMQVNGILSVFLNTSERALAGYVTHNTGAVGLLDISQKFPMMATQLFNSATNSLLSAITHLHTLGEREQLIRIYLRSSRYLNALNGLALGFMAPFAGVLIAAWMGQSVPSEDAAALLLYAAIGFHVHALTAPVTSYFQAINSPGRTLWTFIVPQIALLAIGLGWMYWQGERSLIELAKMVMLTRIVSSLGIIVYANAQLRIGQSRYFKQVGAIGALPYLIGYLLCQAVSGRIALAGLPRWDALGVLFVLGMVYFILTCGVIYGLLSTTDERRVVQGMLSKLGWRPRAETAPRPGFFSIEAITAPANFNRWLIPPAALCVHLCIGEVYAFSVFNEPLTRLLGITASAPDDWKLTTVGWIFSLAILFLGLSAAFGGSWLERVGPRKTMFYAALCFGGGFLVAAAGVHYHRIALVFLGYGVLGGIGLGLGYVSPVSTLIKWFPDRRGLAAGLAIMGFGGGAMIGAPLAVNLMGYFHSPESVGIAETFLAMGAIYLVYMMIGACAIRVPPKDWKPAGWVPSARRSRLDSKYHVHIDQAHKTPQFYLLWLVLCLNVTAGIGVLGQASLMIQEMFRNSVTATAAAGFVGLLSLFNMGGRFVWASASDYLGRKPTYMLFFVVGALLYAAVPFIGQSGNVHLFVLCYAVILSFYGGGFSTIPAYLADTFGTRFVGGIHGRLLTAWSTAGVAGPVLVNYLREWQIEQGVAKADAYSFTMWIMAGLLLLGFFCNLFVREVHARHHLVHDEVSEL